MVQRNYLNLQDGRRTLRTGFEKAIACFEQEGTECLKRGYHRKECSRTRLHVRIASRELES